MQTRRVRLGDVGRVVTGKTPPTSRVELFGQAYPFITPTDIRNDCRHITTERSLSEEGRRSQSNLLLPAEAISFVCIGATIGKICMTSGPSFTNQQINSIIVDREQHDPNFIFYKLRLVAEDIKVRAGGAATPIINKSAFSDFEIDVPSLEKQRRSALILSAYDDLIENMMQRITIIEEMARRLYDEWFVHFRFPGSERSRFMDTELGRVPQDWTITRLGDILELRYGKAMKADDRTPGPYPVFGSSGVVGTHSSFLVEGPGIIVGRKGNVGSVHWSHDPFFPIDTVFYVVTSMPLAFVFHLLQRQKFLNSDAAVPGLNREQAHRLKIVVPSSDLVQRFQSHCYELFQAKRICELSISNLRTTRDFLLPKLISGEIEVSPAAIQSGAVAA